jgi:anthranilate synthase/phosphoribosyltransferase
MFLLIDNYDSFTYNLVQAFSMLGDAPVVVYNDDPRLLDLATNPEVERVCISPGPSHPINSGYCLEFLKRLDPSVPVLGICLGHQILGLHAGSEVLRAPHIMHGKTSDITHDGQGLFKGVANPMCVGRYHSLAVQVGVDEKNPLFKVTARGPAGEVMALQYVDRPWVGVQFHPESVLTPDGMKLLANFPQAILSTASAEMQMKQVLNALAEGRNLSAALAGYAFESLMDAKLPPVQAGAFLMGLRLKGESPLEVAQAARVALARSIPVTGIDGDFIDVVGTGGDGRHSFNCSTATALTLAGMGYQVVKHGNRAITSLCGSADVLERLGIPINTMATDVPKRLKERNFVFLYAPLYHPIFSRIAPLRKELGIRSIFNLLGPLLNPARPTHILLGVARPELLKLMAETLRLASVKRAAVVFGAGGYDELTPLGISKLIFLREGELEEMEINPADYDIAPCTEEDLRVDSLDQAERVMRDLLEGRATQAVKDMVSLNVGVALYLLNPKMPLTTCMAKARETVAGGVGRKVLHGA